MTIWKKILSLFVYFLLFLSLIGICLLLIYKPNYWVLLLFLDIFILYFINIVFSIYVFFSRRNDVRKKTWILFFCIAPFIAPFVFLWFGFNPFSKKEINAFKQIFDQELKKDKKINLINNNLFDNFQLTMKNLSFYEPASIQIEYIQKIEQSYKQIIKLIQSAKKCIILNYFIIGDGIFFKTIINELKKKKDEGVEIYFIYDWVWTNRFISKKILKKISVEINMVVFKPKKQLILTSKHNNRNHKKYIIVDGVIGIYGGANISDEYINQSNHYNYWMDTNFIIKGRILIDLINSFIFDYKNYCLTKKAINMNLINEIINDNKKLYQKHDNNAIAYLWDSFPEYESTICLNVYKNLFPFIKKELYISTPYLYPTEELYWLLEYMVRRGVQIKFLLPGLSDNKKVITWLNRSEYIRLINMGAKIYELNAFNHGKYWVIDDELTLVSSVNLDPRAMIINYESSMLIYDKKFNKQMKQEFNNSIKYAKEYTIDDFTKNKRFRFKVNFIKKILMLFEPAL